MTTGKKEGLDLLLEPFPEEMISLLPKPTVKAEEYKKLKKGHCKECGGYHATSNTIHLAYVGHATLTLRLLQADKNWTWEPLAFDSNGLPLFDNTGGLWIKLTVCGVTRLGYGNAKNNPYADVGSREKEVIGDALRNAAMRFGAALDLWSKVDLSKVVEGGDQPQEIPIESMMEEIETFFVNGKTEKDIDDFINAKLDFIETLDETDKFKMRVCIRETKSLIREKAANKGPKTVKCPESGKQVVKTDCLESECHKECPVFGNNKKSKLEMKV